MKCSYLAAAAILLSCGSPSELQKSDQRIQTKGQQQDADAVGAEAAVLSKTENEQVLNSLVIRYNHQEFGLQGDAETGWTVDMEQVVDLKGTVDQEKYLRVKGDLIFPKIPGQERHEVGCLFVELKDNVYYREQTWLRVSTTGISGETFKEVVLPLSVDMNGDKEVPTLPESMTLAQFEGDTVKSFDGSVCFSLDFAGAPAQDYKGEILVQYLRPGDATDPSPCQNRPDAESCQPQDDPPVVEDPGAPTDTFICGQDPASLKAGQSLDLYWESDWEDLQVEHKLASDPINYAGSLGELQGANGNRVRYVAPDAVQANVRILVSAKALGIEALPTFCEIQLMADDEIVLPDDGEVTGMVGNIFYLEKDTKKLPDFDTMTPLGQVVIPNFDIPKRSFSKGFPGVRDLYEWFGLRFEGRIYISEDRDVDFKLSSDDGANLYIDGAKVIDNDGIHPVRSKSNSISLSKGWHDIRVDYYQGPRYHIALQLFWRNGSSVDWKIIPPSAFERPLR